MDDPRFSQSAIRGLAVLNSFSGEHPVRGIQEMAKLLGLRASTTHRYATTLLTFGWLEQTSGRRYRVGPRAADVAICFLDANELRRAAREHLRQLRDQTGYTVAIGILDGIEVVCLDQFRGHRRGQFKMDDGTGAGVRTALDHSAIGRALLAHLDPEERQAIVNRLWSAEPGGRTVLRSWFLQTLEKIRTDRYGTTLVDEPEKLGFSLAAPVIGTTGRAVAAVQISASTSSASPTEELIAALSLRLTAAAVSISLSLPKPETRHE